MNFIKKNKGKISAGILILLVLTVSFFCTGNNPGRAPEDAVKNESKSVLYLHNAPETSFEPAPEADASEKASQVAESEPKITGQEKMNESDKHPDEDEKIIPEENSASKETEEAKPLNGELTCTLSVRCDNALGKAKQKADAIADNGIIFEEQTVVFYEGESVFNILVRELKKRKIHLEFVSVPVYNSSYIEGISNLYEFDCGELSGWMYKVNGWFPNFGCSRYQLKDGDKVEWVYTCDLGKDVGGSYSPRNGR